MAQYSTGQLVRHPRCPSWGVGKVVGVAGPNVSVFFAGVTGRTAAEVIKTINVVRVPLEVMEEQSDPWLDNLALGRDGRIAISARRQPFHELVAVFLAAFPHGFDEPEYTEGPRAATLAAVDEYRSTLGGDSEALAADGALEQGFARTVAAAEAAGLLTGEHARALREALADRPVAKRLLTALRRLTRSSETSPSGFRGYLDAFPLPPEDAGWATVTTLPFLARPQAFGVVHDVAARSVAEILTFRLRFDAVPNWATFASHRALGAALRVELSGLGMPPRDWIDLDHFITSVGGRVARARSATARKPRAARA